MGSNPTAVSVAELGTGSAIMLARLHGRQKKCWGGNDAGATKIPEPCGRTQVSYAQSATAVRYLVLRGAHLGPTARGPSPGVRVQ